MKSKDFYKTTAWKWFSRYVLLYHSFKTSEGLYVTCSTSGKTLMPNHKNMHCGHYIKVYDGNSTNYATAFEFHNVAPQFYADNTKMGGRQDRMREWLVKKYGSKQVERIEIKRRNHMKLDKVTLKIISDLYRNKFNVLAEKKGNPWK
jgi:ribosomal protein L32